MRIAIVVLFHALIPFLFLYAAYLCKIEAKTDGFSVDLIHRDSPQSPLYDPHLNRWERVQSYLRRSMGRAKRNPRIGIFPSTIGDYLMKLSIGTPPFEIFGVADTGSDLIWTQCQPCKHCFEQKRPLFSPRNSSTYKMVRSDSQKCRIFGGTPLEQHNKTCAYALRYLDGSQSHGVLSTDIFTLRSSHPQATTLQMRIVFGCGYKNEGAFGKDTSGIIGLGASSTSLISQMSSVIGGKFSYCLVSNFRSSKMYFGAKAIVSGAGAVSTRYHISEDSYYSLKLKGLSVGNRRFNVGKSNSSQDILMDTGSVVTYLPRKLYSFLESDMKRQINQRPVSITDPNRILRLCYNVSDEIKVPPVTIHFLHANVKLKLINIFMLWDDNTMCLAFSSKYEPIFGSIAQQDFLIGYDLRNKIVSFKPTNCARY